MSNIHVGRITVLVFAAGLSGLLGACASGGGAVAPTTTASTQDGGSESVSDICDIVSDEAVAAVLDAEIVRREPFEEPGTIGCTKGPEQTSIPDFVNVYVFTGVEIADLMDGESDAAPSQPVDGVGDRAVFIPDAGSLLVEDGDDTLSVQVYKAGTPGSLDDCTIVADDMLARRG